MERRAVNPLLMVLVLLVLSCLLVYTPSPPPPHHPYSSVAMPRSLRLESQLQDPAFLPVINDNTEEMEIATAINKGKPVARMDFEVNDYPAPDHNHHGGHPHHAGPGGH